MEEQRIKVNYALPQETIERLKTLCGLDRRSLPSDEISWLVDQEWARRFSEPQPLITVEEAELHAASQA